jgi:hypothetical protein
MASRGAGTQRSVVDLAPGGLGFDLATGLDEGMTQYGRCLRGFWGECRGPNAKRLKAEPLGRSPAFGS